MYLVKVLIEDELETLFMETMVFDFNIFSVDFTKYKEIQTLLVNKGWKPVCNHHYTNDNIHIHFFSSKVEMVSVKDFKDNIANSLTTNLLVYHKTSPNRLIKALESFKNTV